MNIKDITFIYQVANDTCFIQVSNQPVCELTIKGPVEHHGEITGT